jgi:alpha-beta hydrolase superfamily lysophospholipase
MHPIDLEAADGTTLEATVHPGRRSADPVTLVTVHGLGMDMDEGGMFLRLAERLTEHGVTTLRFSLRGHGGSQGEPRDTTIEAQLADVRSTLAVAHADYPGRLYALAAGFGAVPTALALPDLEEPPSGLVLWYPILDPVGTFLDPSRPASATDDARGTLARDGFLLVDEGFELGRRLFEELPHHRPIEPLRASTVPTLIVHGDADTRAAHATAAALASTRANCHLHTVVGADHGFQARSHEEEALRVTIDWLTSRRAV